MDINVRQYVVDRSEISQILTKLDHVDLELQDSSSDFVVKDNTIFGHCDDQTDNDHFTIITNDFEFQHLTPHDTTTITINVPTVDHVESFPSYGLTFDDNISIIQTEIELSTFERLTENYLLSYWNLDHNLVCRNSVRTKDEVERGLQHIASKGYVAPIVVYIDTYMYCLDFLAIPYYHAILGLSNCPIRFFVYKDLMYIKNHFKQIYDVIAKVDDNNFFRKITERDMFNYFETDFDAKRDLLSVSKSFYPQTKILYFVFNGKYKSLNRKLIDTVNNNMFINGIVKSSSKYVSYYSLSDFLKACIRNTQEFTVRNENIRLDVLPENVEEICTVELNNLSNQFQFVQYKDRYNIPETQWVNDHDCDIAIFEDMCMPLNLHNIQNFVNKDRIVIKLFKRLQ